MWVMHNDRKQSMSLRAGGKRIADDEAIPLNVRLLRAKKLSWQ
jgi:hypothetical protein